MSSFELIIKPLLLTKAKKINECCKEFIKRNVLDVGSGRCYIAKEIENKSKVKVTCLDVKDLSQTSMKVIVYDGKHFPFKDDEFDTALIAYVLHHCEEPLQVFKELIRVCKGNIVIFEDTKLSSLTKIMDFFANNARA